MFGAIVILVALLIVIPVSVMMSGALFASVIGSLTKSAVDLDHEGSEDLMISEANPYSG